LELIQKALAENSPRLFEGIPESSVNSVMEATDEIKMEVEGLNYTLNAVCYAITTHLDKQVIVPTAKVTMDLVDNFATPRQPTSYTNPNNYQPGPHRLLQNSPILSENTQGISTPLVATVKRTPERASKFHNPLLTPAAEPKPAPTTVVGLPAEFASLTEEELLKKLRERQAQRQVANRPPYYLTEEEKKLSMDGLHRQWKLERQRRNNEREVLARHDFEDLGELTEEQRELPRAVIRRIIRQRKNEVWANAMRAKGIPVSQCDVCLELTTGNHRCVATKWTTDQTRNAAISKGLVMTQGPGGIRLHAKAIIDQEKLNKEYEQLRILREELEAKARLAQPLQLITNDTTMSATCATISNGPDPPCF